MSEQSSTFKDGMTVTITRGKLKGQTGKVIGVDEQREQLSLQTGEGLTVASFSAVKPPAEKTLTASKFADLETWAEGNPEHLLEAVREYFRP